MIEVKRIETKAIQMKKGSGPQGQDIDLAEEIETKAVYFALSYDDIESLKDHGALVRVEFIPSSDPVFLNSFHRGLISVRVEKRL